MSRATTAEGVLEAIYELAGIDAAPARSADDVFRGHPLAVPPRGRAAVFYGSGRRRSCRPARSCTGGSA